MVNTTYNRAWSVYGKAVIVASGTEGFREIVPFNLMNTVVDSFSSALRNVLWVALATPALAWVISWAME
jgi:hypothetical protein